MVRFFCDFDGTLIDSQKRLYDLFCELCPESKMSYNEYWKIKRNRITQKDFLRKYFKYDDAKISLFHKLWLQKVEEKKRIESDIPVKLIDVVLSKMKKKGKLYLVTNRQKTTEVYEQLKKFGWLNLFDDVLVTCQQTTKQKLVESVGGISSDDIFISDTGEDIVMAKNLGMTTVAVGWGVLSKDILSEYKPDFLLERIEDFDNCKII